MEVGRCGRVHTDEAAAGVEDAVPELGCPSKLEMWAGGVAAAAAVPSLFEEPRWFSRGQEEASKLHRDTRRRRSQKRLTNTRQRV